VDLNLSGLPERLFGPGTGWPSYLAARWLFLRALGLIFFSTFYSLFFQIRGLIGPEGLLPARNYLQQVARTTGDARLWLAPTVLWWSSSDRALLALSIVGLAASLLLVFNLAPRGMIFICLVVFLSFISAAQDFSSYQSDSMLMEAGFISLFFAPSGWRPGWGASQPASRASRYLLVWLWFRIYFESGIAKMLGHDPEWRNFTAMDQYYQNGPLPTWIAWYAQHLPHWFHASTAFLTLALELVLVFAVFLPRRFRLALFFFVTPWEIGIILTSNYAFLNYLVLSLGVLLLDDMFLSRLLPQRLRAPAGPAPSAQPPESREAPSSSRWRPQFLAGMKRFRLWVQGFFLTWQFYATSVWLLLMVFGGLSLPLSPVRALQPFRIADRYGLFAVMTRNRYEIEFQGSRDGRTWVAYPFRYKPQDPHTPPGIFAPYQPRFDWNLWFASLGSWREYPFVLRTEQHLLEGSPDVLALFAGNPFPEEPPRMVRAILWRYWLSDWKQKREEGLWWDREKVALYAPSLERLPDGKIAVQEWPETSDDATHP
jgi:Lipase maturation factor